MKSTWSRRQRRPDAFSNLVLLHQARLRALVAKSIPCLDDVYDIVQEAFVDAFTNMEHFDQECEFGPWLRTLCWNRVHKFLRDRQVRRRHELAMVDEALSEMLPPDDASSDHTLRRISILRGCLQAIGAEHRRVLSLRYHDDIAVQDIGKLLGKTANAVSMLLLRIKGVLQRCVETRDQVTKEQA